LRRHKKKDEEIKITNTIPVLTKQKQEGEGRCKNGLINLLLGN
jgi:hypothetical protein